MPWQFSYEDHKVFIDDLPLDKFVEIEKETGIEWFRLSRSPLLYAEAGKMVAEACAELAGVEMPPLTPRTFSDLFDLVDEPESPTEFTDGVPDPKAPDTEPGTT